MEFINQNNQLIEVDVLTQKYDVNDGQKWEKAHQLLDEAEKQGREEKFFEPNLENKLYRGTDPARLITKSGEDDEKHDDDGYLKNWPAPSPGSDSFVWHKLKEYSQLDEARKAVKTKNPDVKIKIAIIDTGFHPGHPALPLNHSIGISFVKKEHGGPAYDTSASTPFEQEGHGTATMSILAAPYINKEHSNGQFEGEFGGIPFAEIIPIRISETVALIQDYAFVEAVEYAMELGCEVISMSMGGTPSKAWSRVINKAYERGIIVVTAAGNSFRKGFGVVLPKRTLYPARWDRVLAVTGISADQLPYSFDARLTFKSSSSEDMQGNYGPANVMHTAIASYSPNISWGTMNKHSQKKYFHLAGAGTSSATPQVAAAAALYICYYREELNEIMKDNPKYKWKKAEKVRRT